MENALTVLKHLSCSLRRAVRPLPNLLSLREQVTFPPWGPRFLADCMKILHRFSCQAHSSYEILGYSVNYVRYTEIRCQHLLTERRYKGPVSKGRGPSLQFWFSWRGKQGVGSLLPPQRNGQRRRPQARLCPGQEMVRCLRQWWLLVVSRKERKYQWWSHGQVIEEGAGDGGRAAVVTGVFSCDLNKVSLVQRGGWKIRYRYRYRYATLNQGQKHICSSPV